MRRKVNPALKIVQYFQQENPLETVKVVLAMAQEAVRLREVLPGDVDRVPAGSTRARKRTRAKSANGADHDAPLFPKE